MAAQAEHSCMLATCMTLRSTCMTLRSTQDNNGFNFAEQQIAVTGFEFNLSALLVLSSALGTGCDMPVATTDTDAGCLGVL